ncbi:MAG: M13 family metallopeptidase [Bacilli bacterium]|nr:M13 family metallopeptidase [Bacilli bacterium]
MSDIRIQDDLYEYVNHDWLETAVIPDDKPTVGGFADLDTGVEKILMGDIKKMVEIGDVQDEDMANVVKLYKVLTDTKKRNRQGAKPALKVLKRVTKLKNVAALNRNLKDFVLDGLPLPFSFSVDADMKDTTKHMVNIQGPSTILPDSSYYKEERAQQKQMMIGLWTNMTKAVLAKAGLGEEEIKAYVEDTLKFDEIIGGLVKSSEEWADYPKAYNPMKVGRVNSLLKPIKFKKLLSDIFGYVPEMICVGDPRFLKGFSTLFNEGTFEAYKHWAFVTELLSATSVLSEELRDLGGTYRRALSGIAAAPTLEKFAYRYVSRVYAEPLGLYYGRKYFGEEAKADVVSIVREIIETYKGRIMKNEILSEETREKAILKLSTIEIKMGYPDKVDPKFKKMQFDDSLSAYEISLHLGRILREDNMEELGKPVDRTKWPMPGHMVNACYNPFANDITFPAAILQAPFYSIHQSRSQNLGGIGAVIGHEISHAFDNNGAQFDENGNLKNWWTKEDFKKFAKKTKAMIDEFDGIELPWGKVNGKFVVSENIADNGGMGVTLEMMANYEEANYEEYFTNWAKVWCMKAKPQYLQLLISVDVHAPAILRANMQPRNFNAWYDTFKVTSKDKMYLKPNKRVSIW